MVVNRNTIELGNIATKESKGFLVTKVKTLLDTGSCSDMISLGLKSGMLSLGHKEMCINTTIGKEERLVEEVKISMLESDGKVRNIRATTSVQGKISPDHLSIHNCMRLLLSSWLFHKGKRTYLTFL